MLFSSQHPSSSASILFHKSWLNVESPNAAPWKCRGLPGHLQCGLRPGSTVCTHSIANSERGHLNLTTSLTNIDRDKPHQWQQNFLSTSTGTSKSERILGPLPFGHDPADYTPSHGLNTCQRCAYTCGCQVVVAGHPCETDCAPDTWCPRVGPSCVRRACPNAEARTLIRCFHRSTLCGIRPAVHRHRTSSWRAWLQRPGEQVFHGLKNIALGCSRLRSNQNWNRFHLLQA